MVTITDGRTGRPAEVPSARHGLLRLCEHLAMPGGAPGTGDMRVVVVGDVLLRVLERTGVQVAMVWDVPDGTAAESPAPFHPVVAALGAHPPSDVVRGAGVTAALGGQPDVRVGPAPGGNDGPGGNGSTDGNGSTRGSTGGAAGGGGGEGAWLRIGPATAEPLPAPEQGGSDLLAVRLALLDLPHGDPAKLDRRSLEAADEELRRWRALTARWATSPSRPVPPELRRQAESRLADDLDTRAVLDLLREIATSDAVPDGVKFETFALLDGVLGLELAREVG
ncbi:hypothetical protein [Streptomyces sp. TS71-3]|uniref:hypothetical protein n=1 Tax=Streptomyces sp. TS71-3 TaxID=2733862 RepID=UPI001B23D229|nr:hypothetical protein [Streptomyces sp. TS71-3]GHJ39368.1 hypothetical protein Sm713_49770 [Streptomyces sp. TS71-3]